MFTRVSLFLCFAIAVFGQSVSVTTNSNWNAQTGTYRALNVVQSSDGYIITGVKVQAGSGSVSLDAARFAVGNGQGSGNPPGFYLGVLAASASAAQLANNTSIWTGSVSAAFAEVIASFQSIIVYYDLDSTAGFQYTLGTDMWTGCNDTSKTPTVDCTFDPDNIQLKNLVWSNVQYVNTPCSGASAPVNCSASTFYMTGSVTAGATPIIRLNFTLATHPVTVTTVAGNQVNLDPDHGKIDVDIMYNWTSRINTRTSPKIALIATAGGKAGAGAAVFAAASSNLQFAGTIAGKATTFAWNPTAKVDLNGNSQVQVEVITDTQVLAACPLVGGNCTIPGGLFVGLLKVVVSFINGINWSCEFIIFSWTDSTPALVSWDPTIGQNAQTNSPTTTTGGTTVVASPGSPAAVVTFSVVLLLCTYLYHRVF